MMAILISECVHIVSYWYNCESVVSVCTSVISFSTTILCAMLELSDRAAFCEDLCCL